MIMINSKMNDVDPLTENRKNVVVAAVNARMSSLNTRYFLMFNASLKRK